MFGWVEKSRFRLQHFRKTVEVVWFSPSVFCYDAIQYSASLLWKRPIMARYRIMSATYSLMSEPNKTRILEDISEAALPDTENQKWYRPGTKCILCLKVKGSVSCCVASLQLFYHITCVYLTSTCCLYICLPFHVSLGAYLKFVCNYFMRLDRSSRRIIPQNNY